MNFSRPGGAAKLLLLVLLSFSLYFWGLGSYGLLEPDEGRYSEIPREMRETGDYITPRLNYIKYFEKPVLHYWLTASAQAVFGENEFSGRFWPALLALGGVLLTYLTARSMFDRDTALYSSVILTTSLVYFTFSRINITDMPLSFFLTAAMTGFWFGLQKDRRFYLLLYGGAALALLTKGLIGIVLPGGIIFWYMVLTRRWDIVRSALYLPGIILFAALSLPWFVAVCVKNSDFFYFFFIREHFLRYATKMHGKYEPVWFFIPILVAGLFPWTGLLPGAIRSVLPSRIRAIGTEKREELFLFLWFAVIFLFFSLSRSKLVPYIIPVFPPLAVLMGRVFREIVSDGDGRGMKWFLLWNSAFLVPFILALFVYPFFNSRISAGRLLPYTLPVALALSAFVAAGWYFYRKSRFRLPALFLCLLAFLVMFSFSRVFTLYDGLISARDLAGIVAELRRPGDVIAQYGNYDQGLPFYLKQRIVLVNYLGELEFGAKQEEDPFWFIGTEQLQELWRGNRRVILVINSEHEKTVFALLAPNISSVAARTERRIILVNHP
ncbi:phospholipid carrier-dependent glycosyltransferase [Aminivibrio sp.]|jgi:4-amino-4-deoxy-L-arabinose transferase-like glycosyltransferase|uniref:phospholipid carrier-dependent glycosyltransferase n=1 Tax=Aminivibrio sp. TaxID=1872489 RepID=UPI001A56F169|nr:phospholipid carrier-dependent glycosyltransferase [Aminivibrio sp.]MBL3539153.1 glycosyltransferase family 39 protein [Aminivibrio sp.]